MGCAIVEVYKDHGISGAKGRDTIRKRVTIGRGVPDPEIAPAQASRLK
jgi:hypothetical protein